jgi:hypothetical protein
VHRQVTQHPDRTERYRPNHAYYVALSARGLRHGPPGIAHPTQQPESIRVRRPPHHGPEAQYALQVHLVHLSHHDTIRAAPGTGDEPGLAEMMTAISEMFPSATRHLQATPEKYSHSESTRARSR